MGIQLMVILGLVDHNKVRFGPFRVCAIFGNKCVVFALVWADVTTEAKRDGIRPMDLLGLVDHNKVRFGEFGVCAIFGNKCVGLHRRLG